MALPRTASPSIPERRGVKVLGGGVCLCLCACERYNLFPFFVEGANHALGPLFARFVQHPLAANSGLDIQ